MIAIAAGDASPSDFALVILWNIPESLAFVCFLELTVKWDERDWFWFESSSKINFKSQRLGDQKFSTISPGRVIQHAFIVLKNSLLLLNVNSCRHRQDISEVNIAVDVVHFWAINQDRIFLRNYCNDICGQAESIETCIDMGSASLGMCVACLGMCVACLARYLELHNCSLKLRSSGRWDNGIATSRVSRSLLVGQARTGRGKGHSSVWIIVKCPWQLDDDFGDILK